MHIFFIKKENMKEFHTTQAVHGHSQTRYNTNSDKLKHKNKEEQASDINGLEYIC
jgi:hypothetical protein